MLILAGEERLPDDLRGASVAIGNFDGVHRGHQVLLATAAQQGGLVGRPWGVVTFEPHPRSWFRPHEPVFRLSPPQLKGRLIGSLGASFMAQLTFDRAFASLEAEEFVRRILVGRLGVGHVVTGHDFHFGHGRKGNAETMRLLGQRYGYGVSVVEQVADADSGAPFASSAIRGALRRGHVREAAEQLGYWWTVLGTVVRGDQRGRTIGFPTANIVLEPGCEPAQGIYAVRVRREDDPAVALPGAGYIGVRPTFDTQRLFLEVHLLGFSGDLYGKTLAVEFVSYIRPDRRFDGVEALVRQMTADCTEIETVLAAIDGDNPMAGYRLGRLQEEGRLAE